MNIPSKSKKNGRANRRIDLYKDGKLETVSKKDFFDYEY